MKAKRLVVTGSILAVLFAAGITYKHQQHEKALNQRKTVAVSKSDIVERVVAVGTISPKQSISVTSIISGTVDKIYHQEGDYIKAGTPLLQVKPNPTPQSLAAAKRDLQEKQVAEISAQATFDRYREGIKTGAISKDDFNTARKNYETSRLERQMAQENLDLLAQGKANVDGETVDSTIRSPISGNILSRYIDVGDPVVAQTQSMQGNTLFTIANMHQLIFTGQVDEIDAGRLHVGMPAKITVAALPHAKVYGKLSEIALQSVQASAAANAGKAGSSIDSSNTSAFNVGFDIKVNHLHLPKNITLRAGYSATAKIIVKQAKNVLSLPERVIVFRKGKSFVKLLNPKGKASFKAVKLGLSDGLHVQILSGLKLGQKVLDQATQGPLSKHSA